MSREDPQMKIRLATVERYVTGQPVRKIDQDFPCYVLKVI